MYLAQNETQNIRRHRQDRPNRTNRFIVMNHLGDFIAFLNFMSRASCDRFFDEYSDSGKMFKNLHFYVTARLQRSAEHGWAADDDDPGTFGGGHVFDEFIKGLIDTSVLVRRNDEGIALFLQDGSRPFDCRVY